MKERKFYSNRPIKKEMLVKKAEKRTERLKLRDRLIGFSPKRLAGTGETFALIIILGINLFLLLNFFGKEDKVNVFSAPLIPVLAKMTSLLMPYDYGIRFWLLIFQLIFPICFYFFIREVSKRRLASFISVLIASLPIGIFLSLRAEVGLLTEDGGQVASLTLTALACLFLLRFLRQGTFRIGFTASLMIVLTGLTSPLGLFILACYAGAITFSEMLLSNARLKFFRSLTVFLLAIGLSAFWYNPKFVFLIINSFQGELLKKTLINLIPVSFFMIPLAGTIGFLVFENRPHLQSLSLAGFLTIGFGSLSLGAGMDLSSPSRFLPSFGISLAFLMGVLLVKFFDFLRAPASLKKFKFLSKHKKLISYLSVFLCAVLFLIIVNVSGRAFREKPEVLQTLGLSTFKRTGIWEMRKETGIIGNILGINVTVFTAGGIVFLKKKLGKV